MKPQARARRQRHAAESAEKGGEERQNYPISLSSSAPASSTGGTDDALPALNRGKVEGAVTLVMTTRSSRRA